MSVDPQTQSVIDWLSYAERPQQVGLAVREAIDLVLDGLRTGRYRIDQLEKVEKTFLGTKVEQCVLYALDLPKNPQGEMDTQIAGVPVDVKFSIHSQWMIPMEAVGEVCMLVHGDDETGDFSLGVIRIADEMLSGGGNRDRKRTLKAESRDNDVHWIVRNGTFPKNFFTHIGADDLEAIFSKPTGQQKVRELFRRVHRVIVPRTALETVAQQTGARERARDAKFALEPEGIRIFTSRDNRELKKLGLTKLPRGVWYAVKADDL